MKFVPTHAVIHHQVIGTLKSDDARWRGLKGKRYDRAEAHRLQLAQRINKKVGVQ